VRNVHTICLIQNTEVLFTEAKNVHFVGGTHILSMLLWLAHYLLLPKILKAGVHWSRDMRPSNASAC
jgi:hypothetical protein